MKGFVKMAGLFVEAVLLFAAVAYVRISYGYSDVNVHPKITRNAATILENDGFYGEAYWLNQYMEEVDLAHIHADKLETIQDNWYLSWLLDVPGLGKLLGSYDCNDHYMDAWNHEELWIGTETAAEYADSAFNLAVGEWRKGNTRTAMYCLGHALHVLQDLAEPHHAAAYMFKDHGALSGRVNSDWDSFPDYYEASSTDSGIYFEDLHELSQGVYYIGDSITKGYGVFDGHITQQGNAVYAFVDFNAHESIEWFPYAAGWEELDDNLEWDYIWTRELKYPDDGTIIFHFEGVDSITVSFADIDMENWYHEDLGWVHIYDDYACTNEVSKYVDLPSWFDPLTWLNVEVPGDTLLVRAEVYRRGPGSIAPDHDVDGYEIDEVMFHDTVNMEDYVDDPLSKPQPLLYNGRPRPLLDDPLPPNPERPDGRHPAYRVAGVHLTDLAAKTSAGLVKYFSDVVGGMPHPQERSESLAANFYESGQVWDDFQTYWWIGVGDNPYPYRERRGLITFDISGVHTAVVLEAELNLTNYEIMGSPFTDLGSLFIKPCICESLSAAFNASAPPWDHQTYFIDPLRSPSFRKDVTSDFRNAFACGQNRLQYTLWFQQATDRDGVGDYIKFNKPTLNVRYMAPKPVYTPAYRDLVVTMISVNPEKPLANSPLQVNFTIGNLGTISTGNFSYALYVEEPPKDLKIPPEELWKGLRNFKLPSYTQLLNSTHTGLSASETFESSWNYTPNRCGLHEVKVVVDALDEVMEKNETNNILDRHFEVGTLEIYNAYLAPEMYTIVVPEFISFLTMPLFMLVTLMVIAVLKRKSSFRRH